MLISVFSVLALLLHEQQPWCFCSFLAGDCILSASVIETKRNDECTWNDAHLLVRFVSITEADYTTRKWLNGVCAALRTRHFKNKEKQWTLYWRVAAAAEMSQVTTTQCMRTNHVKKDVSRAEHARQL